MPGLLSGLGKFGLKNMEELNLYEEPKKEEVPAKEGKPAAPVIKEEDFLYDKHYECPVCYKKIAVRTVKTGKARLLRIEMNLRPVYENLEPLKYDIIACPYCGYAVNNHYFHGLMPSQRKNIKEVISLSYQPPEEKKDTYTYEDAFELYQLSLANAIVKQAKASEKAYICLKSGWLLRSMLESLDKGIADYEQKVKEIEQKEREFLKNALDGFLTARQNEHYPMAGMDEITSDYLIGVLAMEFEQYDIAARMISTVILSASASKRIKEKAREVRELLIAKIKKKKQTS